jgi:hypothetical protein
MSSSDRPYYQRREDQRQLREENWDEIIDPGTDEAENWDDVDQPASQPHGEKD